MNSFPLEGGKGGDNSPPRHKDIKSRAPTLRRGTSGYKYEYSPQRHNGI
jgi:hypothetical protein